ncbi:MAG: glutathione S-transferase family protein [Pseudomonadota bacterium]
MSYVLYAARYSRSQLVEMVFAEGDIAYEKREFSIRTGDNRSAEFMAANPYGWIPGLVTPDGQHMGETPAINFWLAEQHGLTQLVPSATDPDRGPFLSAFHNVLGEIEPAMKRVFYPARYVTNPEDADAARELAWVAMEERLALIEPILAANGPFFLGERFSLADLTLAYWNVYTDIRRDLRKFPAIAQAYDLTCARPKTADLFQMHIDQTG